MDEMETMRPLLAAFSEEARLRAELIRARAAWIEQARARLWERMDRLRRMQAEAGLHPSGAPAPAPPEAVED